MLHILTNRKNKRALDISKFISGAGYVKVACFTLATYINGVLQQSKQTCYSIVNLFHRSDNLIYSNDAVFGVPVVSTNISNDNESLNATLGTSLTTTII